MSFSKWAESVLIIAVAVESLGYVPLFVNLCSAARCFLVLHFSWSFLKLLLPSVFPAAGSFPVSQLFALDGRSIGASDSASVLAMNIQWWFPLKLTCLISVQSKTLKSLLQHHSWLIALILQHSALFMIQLSHLYRTTGKTIALIRWTFASYVSAF